MSIEDDILIERYLKNELSKEDLIHFEKRINVDFDFKEKVIIEKELFKSLNENEWNFVNTVDESQISDYKSILNNETTVKLRQTLKEIDSNYKVIGKKKSNKIWLFSAIAASVIIFFAINVFINSNVSNEDLYDDYIKSPNLPSFVSRNSEDFELELIEAQKMFEAKSYEEAQIIFEKILKKTSDNATLYLYTGITQAELNEFSKAEKTFDTLINSDLFDAEKGYWYKALLYLKADRVDEAKVILKKIISKSLFNYTKAKKLLDDLK